MITAALVKELREKTGAGMMDCKKALTECDGDIAKSIDWLREKGIAKAAKKNDRIAAEGLTRVGVEGNTGVIFEVNSETDFVAKNEQFLELLEKMCIRDSLWCDYRAVSGKLWSGSCHAAAGAGYLSSEGCFF